MDTLGGEQKTKKEIKQKRVSRQLQLQHVNNGLSEWSQVQLRGPAFGFLLFFSSVENEALEKHATIFSKLCNYARSMMGDEWPPEKECHLHDFIFVQVASDGSK